MTHSRVHSLALLWSAVSRGQISVWSGLVIEAEVQSLICRFANAAEQQFTDGLHQKNSPKVIGLAVPGDNKASDC